MQPPSVNPNLPSEGKQRFKNILKKFGNYVMLKDLDEVIDLKPSLYFISVLL